MSLIIDRQLFDDVQTKLNDNRAAYHRDRTIGSQALLTGLIFDDRGNVMSPSKSRRPGGKHYLYYVSQARLQRREADAMRPVPASILENIVLRRLRLVDAAKRRSDAQGGTTDAALRELVRQVVKRVTVSAGGVSIVLHARAIASRLRLPLKQISKVLRTSFPEEDKIEGDDETISLTVPICLWLRGGLKRIEGWDKPDWTTSKPHHNRTLIKALAQAHQWREWIEHGDVLNLQGLAERTGLDRKHAHAILKLAFLAPDIQNAILAGRQPKTLTFTALTDVDLPLLWGEQRTLLRVGQADPTFRRSGV